MNEREWRSMIEELQREWRSREWIDKHMAEIEPIDAIFTPQYACADELNELLEVAKEMERIGEKLARSLGHSPNCPNLGRPCNCGSKGDQADALTEYERWKRAAKGGSIGMTEQERLREQITRAREILTSCRLGLSVLRTMLRSLHRGRSAAGVDVCTEHINSIDLFFADTAVWVQSEPARDCAGAPTMHYSPENERREQRESLNWIAERAATTLAATTGSTPLDTVLEDMGARIAMGYSSKWEQGYFDATERWFKAVTEARASRAPVERPAVAEEKHEHRVYPDADDSCCTACDWICNQAGTHDASKCARQHAEHREGTRK